MTQPVLFFSFANSPTQPLAELTEEDNNLRDLFHDRAFNSKHFHIHRESHADLDSIRQYFTEFKNQVWLFHYAGHADSEQLLLTSGEAQAGGIAAMLGEQSNLKLVFLNGCSTQEQVQALLKMGIPAIIATRTPINDTLARQFSWHFYHALEVGATIKEAFDGAGAYIQAAGKPTPTTRSLTWDKDEFPDDDTWGLFFHPDKEDVLSERLPSGVRENIPVDFEPNELLIKTIWDALVEEEIVSEGRKKAKLSRKRMGILNNFPAPVAEHLRKLFVPLGDADEGYNKISINRLRQLAQSYQVLMELMTFTLLAQLWEFQLKGIGNVHSEEVRASIQSFLNMPDGNRNTFPFIPFISQLRMTLDQEGVDFFVEEFADMPDLMKEDSDFRKACIYFDFLRKRLQSQSDVQIQPEINRLCMEAEQHLAALFSDLGYLARYTLATVKQIVVKKYRHTLLPRFQHVVVRLVDLLGGMDEEEEIFGHFLDSQSVLLLKEDEEADTLPFLNLSPFIIDENAFVDNSDVSKIYFYHHLQSQPSAWAYRWVHKPSDPVLLVPGQEFEVVGEQMQAFIENIK